MRPLRFLLTLVSFVVAFCLLLYIGPWRSSTAEQQLEQRGTVATYFNWRTPSSLFPPSAIISITDDNSTNFLARPAAFGPLLPVKSLSGQLWIGSGFGDESHLGRGGEGELGCSDVPGWEDGSWKKILGDGKSTTAETSNSLAGKSRRNMVVEVEDEEDEGEEHPSEDDGTDDYLHHPLPASDGLKANGEAAGKTKKPAHADIQSLQESAEIAGKVVLLKRGGCGFLEKVKWAQRRGGIALIVGDDVRGGQLVTMYARGDTSNVTIPSVFTSYTTAQLLTSLMPSGSMIDYLDESTRLGLVLGGKGKSEGEGAVKSSADKAVFTTTTATSNAKATAKSSTKDKSSVKSSVHEQDKQAHRGWFASIFGFGRKSHDDSRRPPNSGNAGWVLQDFEDENEYIRGKIVKHATTTHPVKEPASTPREGLNDGFQIGVQDWRDPDLVAEQKEQQLRGTASTSSSSTAVQKTNKLEPTSLKGGSITPGSGEYIKANHELVDIASSHKTSAKDSKSSQQIKDQQGSSRGWFSRLFSSHPSSQAVAEPVVQKTAVKAAEQDAHRAKTEQEHRHSHPDVVQMHEGLWVTLSPTSMSTSPFFDTLLVLVVSPLVTLTVVYALLLLRSRIRRRRWRAPKSVVERLPVRTYQTMPSGANSSAASSTGSPPTATTPLLPPSSRPINTGQRPRARTESEVPLGSGALVDGVSSPSLEQIEEKRAAGLAEWRRRYKGKQKECAVCLEEYVDGVSKVMSLPCGHEFHPECITPWLTTRRRTCPICKGDVVRSLARTSGVGSSSSTSPRQHYQEAEEDEDVQEQAVTTLNEDPASQMPVSRDDEAFEDLERGMAARTPTPDRNR